MTCESLKSSPRRRFKRKLHRWRWLHDGHRAEKDAAALGVVHVCVGLILRQITMEGFGQSSPYWLLHECRQLAVESG
jgi:hypothetical protein